MTLLLVLAVIFTILGVYLHVVTRACESGVDVVPGRWRTESGLIAHVQEHTPWDNALRPWAGFVILPSGERRENRWEDRGVFMVCGSKFDRWDNLVEYLGPLDS